MLMMIPSFLCSWLVVEVEMGSKTATVREVVVDSVVG